MRKEWQEVANQALARNGLAPMPSIPPGLTGQKRVPIRPQSIESEVSVPLRQALISGALLLLCLATETALFWFTPWYVGVAGIAVWLAILGIWFVLMLANRPLLWQVENVFNVDLDGDKQKGPPPEVFVTAMLGWQDESGQPHWRKQKLPAPSPEYLKMFAQDVLAGRASFSEIGTKETPGANAYGYSGDMWERLRDRFQEAGWAVWRNERVHKQGVELTEHGRAMLTEIASDE